MYYKDSLNLKKMLWGAQRNVLTEGQEKNLVMCIFFSLKTKDVSPFLFLLFKAHFLQRNFADMWTLAPRPNS